VSESAPGFEPIEAAPPVAPLEPGAPPLAILVDYDGTIALNDVSDQIMAEHVPGDWEAEAAKYDAGGMGSRRLMTWEVDLIDADPAELYATAASQPHDPGFVPLVERAKASGIPIEVVSDGFRVLHPAGPCVARPGRPAGRHGEHDVLRSPRPDRVPQRHPTCLVCGTCKARARPRAPGAGPGGRVHR
jgi:hypothetical protein